MSLKERVEKILKEKPYCKDNDNSLCSEIWNEDCQKLGYNLSELSALEFIHLMDTGELSKQQTILRIRRGLNNKQVETRGKSYKANLKKKPIASKLRVVKKRDNVKESEKSPFTIPSYDEPHDNHIEDILYSKG